MDKRPRFSVFRRLHAILFAALLTLSGCAAATPAGRIYDNRGVYARDRAQVSVLWIDITDGGGTEFARVDGTSRINGEKPVFSGALRAENGEINEQDASVPVSLTIKGNQLYKGIYRSYKLTLSGEDLWRGQRVFTLYKCPADATKIIMRFGLDAFSLLGNIVSVDSNFVHLFMRDGTLGETEYRDMGLYTQAENPGGRYLRAHGLDRNGELYEIKDFSFDYEAWTAMDDAARDDALEIKNGENIQKFENMLMEISNPQNFEETFNRYFDRENYLTWLAGSILLGGEGSPRGDYLLYSPTDSERWYFFPLPSDKLLLEADARKASAPPESFFGAGMFAAVGEPHRSFLRSGENRDALTNKVRAMYEILSPEAVNGLLARYKTALAQFVAKTPDYALLKYSIAETENLIDAIPARIGENRRLFEENMSKPLPFAVYEPIWEDGAWTFAWDETNAARYRLTVSADLYGEEVVYEIETEGTSVRAQEPLDGWYYAHYEALSRSGEAQCANTAVADKSKNYRWGARLVCLEIPANAGG